jgi:hypothetical protein
VLLLLLLLLRLLLLLLLRLLLLLILHAHAHPHIVKGWSASYARLGPHTVIMFLTAEQLRRMAGLQSL